MDAFEIAAGLILEKHPQGAMVNYLAACQSVSTLLELQRPVHPPAARLGASKAVLDKGMKIREATDYEERLSALEKQLGDAKS